jgi:hypothetical protein
MSNVISSAIFCARNVDKAENQDQIGRWAVVAGQGTKVVDHIKNLDNALGKGTKEAVDVFTKAAKNEKLLGYAGKALDIAAKHVNPLICISSGIDVLRADDKESALITNSVALASMFGVEHLMKKHMDKIPKMGFMKGVSEKVMKFATDNKCEKKLPAIIHGVVFVTGSCLAWAAGQNIGNILIGKKNN